jgi:hypothetical protein
MQQHVADRLNAFKPEELSRRDIDRWAEKAIRIERQSRGIDRIGQAGDAPNLNVNVGVSVGEARDQVSLAERTSVGEFLNAHPEAISGAVGSIAELLAMARAANADGDVDGA